MAAQEKTVRKDIKWRMLRREFLNHADMYRGANVIARVEDTSVYPDSSEEKEWTYGEYIFEIHDCFKRVHVNINLSTAEERENTRFKLNVLHDIVSQFRDAVFEELESIESRPDPDGTGSNGCDDSK